ncbi:hypothetical protein [Sphingomonas sp. TX0522]|uniref:hypothetical protein n=1 Tax=Sphingomonas sp. TX0522 TaxID=2479205 RepID=UPI0018DFE949|nr:hypothetical protein [Sphingomonas sp. TX0522]MBI0530073.1 hypothetical protein [Sphingomonas sp. TX0522]
MRWLWIIGGGVAAAAAMFIAWAVADRFRLADRVAGYDRCEAAAGDMTAALTDCPAMLMTRVDAARRADVCEGALHSGDVYTIRASCPAEVKLMVARRDAALSDLYDARAQIADLTNDRNAAIARAEGRAITFTKRIEANDRIIAAAPRTADGGVRCDAECLRRLAGERAGSGR